jgi:hypothetical protein
MKRISRRFHAWALAIALSAITYAQAGGRPGGTVTPEAGSMNGRGYGSLDVPTSGVGGARSSLPTGRSNRGKANGLNMGTRSGANSDVNRPRNGPKDNGQ